MSTPSTDDQRTLQLDTRVYRLAAIKKAAYKFGDRCHILLAPIPPDRLTVTLKAKSATVDVDHVAGEFVNEVLDQELREVVLEETAAVRSLLLAQAFSSTSLVDQLGETARYESDPLGIRASDRA